MISNILEERRLIGFSYYPVLEIVLGVFFLFMAFFVPLLFGRYNGFKFLAQWDEWLFLLAFFVLFLFLGKNLAYQSLKVKINSNKITFEQDMRDPAVTINVSLDKWNGSTLKTTEASEAGQKFEPMHAIYIIDDGSEKLFYETRSIKEANNIMSALNNLYNVNKGVENDKK